MNKTRRINTKNISLYEFMFNLSKGGYKLTLDCSVAAPSLKKSTMVRT
jgi:hypothetical protein